MRASDLRGWVIPPPADPFPCRVCGETVRTVVSTIGMLLTINKDPDPDGNVIPWPAPTGNGMAQARVITVPVTDQEAWSIHRCR
jgi:hypothetical protein